MSEPVAYLLQHGETGRTRIVMLDQVFTNAPGQWLLVGPLYLHPKVDHCEVMEMALDALEQSRPLTSEDDFVLLVRQHQEAISALRAALGEIK
jgi:hypothetical protein